MATDLMAVTYINSEMRGAPVLNGQAGSLVALLDAFLITGFGLTTATGVTVSGGIATATLPSGKSFDPYAIVLVDGATPAALNGRQRVLTASSTSITWATTAPDGAATGTISIKYAPAAGWEKPFSKTNVAVYRSSDPAGSRFFYRVDDTSTATARVRGYESMTDVDNGVGPFPTDAQISGGGWIGKSYYANSAAVVYDLAADSRMVLWCAALGRTQASAYLGAPARGFGDLIALATGGDPWAAAVSVAANFGIALEYDYGAFSAVSSSSSSIYCARSLAGVGGSLQVDCGPLVGTSAYSGNDTTLGVFPNPADGQLKYSRRFVSNGAFSAGIRAWVPGVLHIPQTGTVAAGVARGNTIAGSGDMAGRTLKAVYSGHPNTTPSGVYLLDITGPWR